MIRWIITTFTIDDNLGRRFDWVTPLCWSLYLAGVAVALVLMVIEIVKALRAWFP